VTASSTTRNPARHGLLNAQDVADLLAVPASWVYAEARAGRMPHVKLGRYTRFRREAVEAWLADAERGVTTGRSAASRSRSEGRGTGRGTEEG
jgi:excisionase family DNA binding protein